MPILRRSRRVQNFPKLGRYSFWSGGLAFEKSKLANAMPRECPICGFAATDPLTISEWRVVWESHRISDDHKKKLEEHPNITVAAIKCRDSSYWE
jgi:hypothetical protein